MKKKFWLLCIPVFFACAVRAQDTVLYKSWNPAADTMQVLEGQAWRLRGNSFYHRLPDAAEQTVRKDVWNLSRNNAGLQLRFRTNASEIIIKYMVTEGMQMPHMPATGVSGIDLYGKTIDGNWVWAGGKFAFGDTITYRFTNLLSSDQHVKNREYYLYFPLYNHVKWMEIQVPAENMFTPLRARQEKPVVVYGTSIAQGGCASRPGLAWTNILCRKIDRPVINLAFSGNGRLEKEVMEYIVDIDARVYVLDCLPNLIGSSYIPNGELRRRLLACIGMLQQKRPGIPVLLTEHDGYTNDGTNAIRKKDYEEANTVLKNVFDSLVAAGNSNIYLLTRQQINQDIESMVDGTHPNDIGMMHYADAYERKLKQIWGEKAGAVSTTRPITQRRDFNTYDWEERHQAVLDYTRDHQPELVLIGNSITHFWGGQPAATRVNGKKAWDKYFDRKNTVNMGFGWDRIENVLWRVYHGELDGFAAKQIVLMIGTNNLQYNTDAEIVAGLDSLVAAIREKQPSASMLVMGIFPRRGMEARVVTINKAIAAMVSRAKMAFADAGPLLLKNDRKIDESLFSDGLHPNEAGYDKLGGFISFQLK
jgi:lysophospholipase L1-like esterase